MLNSKQRAYLRGRGQTLEVGLSIGKEGIGPQLVRQADDYLIAHELLKVQVQRSQAEATRELAQELAEALGADCVQTIGHRFVLYRRSEKLVEEGRAIALPRR